MELLAPINALKEMKSNEQIEIYTDSQYVKLGITEWINKWVLNNWKTSTKEDVKNKDLWIELYDLNKDISETKNIAEKYPDILAKMKLFAKASHEPVTTGKYLDSNRSKHERDRRAKWGTAKEASKARRKK